MVAPRKPRQDLKLFDVERAARGGARQQIGPVDLIDADGSSADGHDSIVRRSVDAAIDAGESRQQLARALAGVLRADAVHDQNADGGTHFGEAYHAARE